MSKTKTKSRPPKEVSIAEWREEKRAEDERIADNLCMEKFPDFHETNDPEPIKDVTARPIDEDIENMSLVQRGILELDNDNIDYTKMSRPPLSRLFDDPENM